MNTSLNSISINDVKLIQGGSYIDDDLVLTENMNNLPVFQEPRRMDVILLALCIQGEGEYSVDTIHHKVRAGDIIIISNGAILDYYKFSPDHKEVVIIISSQYFHEVLAGVHDLSTMYIFSRMHPVYHLDPQKQQNIVDFFSFIKTKVGDTNHHFRRETVQSLLKALIYDAGNTIWQSQQLMQTRRARAEDIFVKFIQLVEQNFRQERRVGWYALQLSITPKYLSEIIKQVSHQTPNEWIDTYVTLELRNLLKNTSKSIKEITEDLRFANQSFLGKYFKEHVGMSPSEYRKSSN